MKIIQKRKILKSVLLALTLSTVFSSVKSETAHDCEEGKASIFCKQSERQKVQWMNWELSNNLTSFKQANIINKKSPILIGSYSSLENRHSLNNTNKPLVNNLHRETKTVKSTRPKFINRNYQYAILALDKKGQSDLRQCVIAIDKEQYKKKMNQNMIKVQTALNLIDSFLMKSFHKNRFKNLSTKLSDKKCTQLFGLIFGATFQS